MSRINKPHIDEVIFNLKELREVVRAMENLWENNPELNNVIDISHIIPMSLDEWKCEIIYKIDELEKLRDENNRN